MLASVTISQLGYAEDTHRSIFDLRTTVMFDEDTANLIVALANDTSEFDWQHEGDTTPEQCEAIGHLVFDFGMDCANICEQIKADATALTNQFTGAEVGFIIGEFLKSGGWDMAILDDGTLNLNTAVV
jgi:hypothetical protein